jgi:hypothetical protein
MLLGARHRSAHRVRRISAVSLAIWPPIVSALLAHHSGRWDLFERSGSITTAIGLLLASRRYIQYTTLELAMLRATAPETDMSERVEEAVTAKLGLALSAWGTIIWGWGTYLGWWSFSCLLVWAMFAVRDLRRDSHGIFV